MAKQAKMQECDAANQKQLSSDVSLQNEVQIISNHF